MSPRDAAITAVAEDIAVRMTKRHESLPAETYKRFLDSNRGIALERAREAVTALEAAGLVVREAEYHPVPGPGDAAYEADFTLGALLRQDLRIDSDVHANGYADTVVHHPAPVEVPIPKTTGTRGMSILGGYLDEFPDSDYYGGAADVL